MPAFFGLWAQHVVGIIVQPEYGENECVSKYRRDIRDTENWGYWMLPGEKCNEDESKRLRHLAWSINQILDDHWVEDPYNILHPAGESLREMNLVRDQFALFQKEERVVRGGARD